MVEMGLKQQNHQCSGVPAMPIPESGIPSPIQLASMMTKLTDATKMQAVAILAAAIVGAAGRTYSVEQALEIVHDIQNAMDPDHSHGTHEGREKTKNERLHA
jgi:hypothetical protein